MIKPGMMLKHKRFMDVMVSVEKVFYAPNKVKIRGSWWNMGQVSPFPIGIQAKFEIAKEGLGDWQWSWFDTPNMREKFNGSK